MRTSATILSPQVLQQWSGNRLQYEGSVNRALLHERDVEFMFNSDLSESTIVSFMSWIYKLPYLAETDNVLNDDTFFPRRTFARKWSHDEWIFRNLREIHQFANGENKWTVADNKSFEHSIFHLLTISPHLPELFSHFLQIKTVSLSWECFNHLVPNVQCSKLHNIGYAILTPTTVKPKKSLSWMCSIYSHVKTIIVLTKSTWE